MAKSAKAFSRPEIDRNTPPRERLLRAGASVFADKGYEGGTVREICELARTSPNMIHHYFGSKQLLYYEVLSLFSERILEVPIRIISQPPQSRENLIARLEIFIGETLEALTADPDLYRTIVRERVIVDAIEVYNAELVKFLELGKKAGIVRPGLDSEMLTGMILDRLGNQILYATWIDEISGANILNDVSYRDRWLRANIDILLHGILTPD